MPERAEPRPKGLELAEALAILQEMARTGLWEQFCAYLEGLLVRARDELELCADLKEMYVTQGGILMLREIMSWKEQLKDDVQRNLTEAQNGDR